MCLHAGTYVPQHASLVSLVVSCFVSHWLHSLPTPKTTCAYDFVVISHVACRSTGVADGH